MPSKRHAKRAAENAARREKLREEIKKFMRVQGYEAIEDIATAFGLSTVEAGRVVAPLVEEGFLKKQICYSKDTFYELAER
jgi:hypothetical protein